MTVIPAIDMISGKSVRLTGGNYAKQTTYSDDPLAVAQGFERAGFTHLHLVDLDGAKASKVVNLHWLERIAEHTSLHIDFGGGVKTTHELERVLGAGAKQVTAGSIAVQEPATVLGWLETYGPDVIILGMDLRDGRIATHGWLEKSALGWNSFLADYVRAGAKRFICTDVSKDGMMSGPATGLYLEILRDRPGIELVASGGIRSVDDLEEVDRAGCSAAIVGKALYEGAIDLERLFA